MINVLGLALYGPLAASTRYRLHQYQPGLADRDINLEVYSLLGDTYLSNRVTGGQLPLMSNPHPIALTINTGYPPNRFMWKRSGQVMLIICKWVNL